MNAAEMEAALPEVIRVMVPDGNGGMVESIASLEGHPQVGEVLAVRPTGCVVVLRRLAEDVDDEVFERAVRHEANAFARDVEHHIVQAMTAARKIIRARKETP